MLLVCLATYRTLLVAKKKQAIMALSLMVLTHQPLVNG